MALKGDALADGGALRRRDGVHCSVVLVGRAQHHARAEDAYPVVDDSTAVHQDVHCVCLARRTSWCSACFASVGGFTAVLTDANNGWKASQLGGLQVGEHNHPPSAHVVQRDKIAQPADDLCRTSQFAQLVKGRMCSSCTENFQEHA